MELEFATTKDMMEELHRRNMRFIFVATENTNSQRKNGTCIAVQGTSVDELLTLIEIGHDVCMDLDEEMDE